MKTSEELKLIREALLKFEKGFVIYNKNFTQILKWFQDVNTRITAIETRVSAMELSWKKETDSERGDYVQ